MLGCAGSSYDEVLRIPCSSYLIESDEAALLLDCGFGSFESYSLLSPDTLLDAIFVSHAHADHSADVEAFLGSTEVWRDQPRLLASKQTMAHIVQDPDPALRGALVLASERTRLKLPNLAVEFSVTTHQMPTLAACVSMGGRRVTYCADTGPTWSVPSSFMGSDLAIVECTLETREVGGSQFHLDAREAGTLARELSANQTLITHVPPQESGESRLTIARSVVPNQILLLAVTGVQVGL